VKDLTHIYSEKEFQLTAKKFKDKYQIDNNCDKTKNNNNANKWKIFKDDFLRLTHFKCPICEKDIDNYDDIDHYRPKKYYDFLKCDYQNFIILCNICNRTCKGEDFPLLDNRFKAKCKDDICNEKPLLINPCVDNIYDYFSIEFVQSNSEQLLILVPKYELNPNSYEYKKAETTIAFYGLGDCIIGKDLKRCRDNKIVDNCRREFMQRMYGTFYDLIESFDDYANKKITKEEIMKKAEVKKRLNYGFYEFIRLKQFRINTI